MSRGKSKCHGIQAKPKVLLCGARSVKSTLRGQELMVIARFVESKREPNR